MLLEALILLNTISVSETDPVILSIEKPSNGQQSPSSIVKCRSVASNTPKLLGEQ